jgi:hypothetical protein
MQFAFDDFPLSSTALLYWLSACSTALLPAAHCDLDRFDSVSAETSDQKAGQSQKQSQKQSQEQSSAALCRCPGPQCSDRSFDDRRVRELASGGTSQEGWVRLSAVKESQNQPKHFRI